MAEAQVIAPSEVELAEATKVREEVEALLTNIDSQHSGLETNFVKLGQCLDTISNSKYWLTWGYKSFKSYLSSIEPRVKRGRTQIYNCLGIARDLLPLIPADQLTKIGVSSANALRLLLKGGGTISGEILELALNGTVAELESAIATKLGLQPDEPGTWFNFGGAKFTDAQREEFIRTVNAVVRVANIHVEGSITNWQDVPSPTKREIFACLCAEFLSTYEAEINGTPGAD